MRTELYGGDARQSDPRDSVKENEGVSGTTKWSCRELEKRLEDGGPYKVIGDSGAYGHLVVCQ